MIDHAECYAKGRVHTNGLENFWSLLKRGIKGTYVSVEPFHLFRYLDEQTFRFNNRYRLQLRFEAFNAFNSVIYPQPNTDFTSQNFGTIADPKGTIYFPRNVQIGVKFLF